MFYKFLSFSFHTIFLFCHLLPSFRKPHYSLFQKFFFFAKYSSKYSLHFYFLYGTVRQKCGEYERSTLFLLQPMQRFALSSELKFIIYQFYNLNEKKIIENGILNTPFLYYFYNNSSSFIRNPVEYLPKILPKYQINKQIWMTR